MSTPRRLDPALQSMLHNLANADGTAANAANAATALSNARKAKIASLRDSFARLQHTHPFHFKPGDLVRWQPGLKYKKLPAYGEPAVVVEVLPQPVFDENAPCGSAYFRSPCSLVLGLQRDGKFSCWHFYGRRFELAT